MAETRTNAYKNARREITKTLTRQGMFISEYMQFKYKDVYKEAGMMYNELNNQYPCKPDLRKTKEFRDWKNALAKAGGESPSYIPKGKKYQYKRTAYWNIALDDVQTTPEAPSHTSDKISETTPETPETHTSNKVMCLNIPLLDASTYRPSQQTVLEEGDQPANQEDHQTDIDQDMTPAILDGIPDETIQRIIQELRADPDLRDIMDDIDQEIHTSEDVEEEIIGLEVDLPELYDPLQEESIFW